MQYTANSLHLVGTRVGCDLRSCTARNMESRRLFLPIRNAQSVGYCAVPTLSRHTIVPKVAAKQLTLFFEDVQRKSVDRCDFWCVNEPTELGGREEKITKKNEEKNAFCMVRYGVYKRIKGRRCNVILRRRSIPIAHSRFPCRDGAGSKLKWQSRSSLPNERAKVFAVQFFKFISRTITAVDTTYLDRLDLGLISPPQ